MKHVQRTISKKKRLSYSAELILTQKNIYFRKQKVSVAGTRTRVSRVRAEYPNQLDYNGFVRCKNICPFI